MRTWIQTYTGRQFDVFAPDLVQIDPVDIAWHLSMKCRYNGATTRFYSVAEHCCVLTDVDLMISQNGYVESPKSISYSMNWWPWVDVFI